MNFSELANGTDATPFGMQWIRVTASIYGACIIVFGTIGNMLSLKIFWNSDIFKESTHFLLIILQIADSCVLLLVVSRYWVQQALRVDIRDLGYPVCLVHVVLTYLCVDFAIWVLVFIVLDRFLAVTYPIRSRLIMTKANVVKLLAGMLALLCAKDLPLLLSHEWKQDAPQRRCMYRERFFKYYLVADSLLNFLVPDSLLLIFNVTIFCSIRKHARLMSEAVRAGSSSGGRGRGSGARSSTSAAGAGTGAGRKRSQDSRQRQMSVARVALVSGTIHLLTTMPSATYLLSHSFITYTGSSFLVNNILLMLSYTNSAINFLIYLPIDGRFRTSFNTMVTPECSAPNNANGRAAGSRRLKRRLLSLQQSDAAAAAAAGQPLTPELPKKSPPPDDEAAEAAAAGTPEHSAAVPMLELACDDQPKVARRDSRSDSD